MLPAGERISRLTVTWFKDGSEGLRKFFISERRIKPELKMQKLNWTSHSRCNITVCALRACCIAYPCVFPRTLYISLARSGSRVASLSHNLKSLWQSGLSCSIHRFKEGFQPLKVPLCRAQRVLSVCGKQW